MEIDIHADHLSCQYTDDEGEPTSPMILQDLSLTFAPGSFVAGVRTQRLRQIDAGKADKRHPAA